jgi:tetratricopeptide (TPR) repeat protein
LINVSSVEQLVIQASGPEIPTDTGKIARLAAEPLGPLVRDRTALLEDLVSSYKETIDLLRSQLNLNVSQIKAALNIVGENDIPTDRIAVKLVEIAQGFNAQRATKLAQDGDSPHTLALKKDADIASEKGQLEAADALLAEAEKEQRLHFDRFGLNIAATAGRRGVISLTRLRYVEAAEHFSDAAGALSAGGVHEDTRIYYLLAQATALYKQGYELGDNNALQAAIKQLRVLVEEGSGKAPSRWLAFCYNNLGAALCTLGQRETNPAKLKDAIASYYVAIRLISNKRKPPLWTSLHGNAAASWIVDPQP